MHRYYTNFNLKQISYAKNNALCAKYIETSQIELIKALLINEKCYFVGNTSKLFFQFDYKDITIVKNVINEAKIINKYLIVNSGTSLKFLGDFCLKNCISNFEKIMTIPGFVGGSIFNNATFLDQGINDNLLKLENNKYSFVSLNTALDCKIKNIINESKTEPVIDCLKKALVIKGGEFFEAFSVKVLTEYFKYKNNKIVTSSVTGGSQDNGIDGIIELTDDLKKQTKILIQSKVRTKFVTLKEVREFYGAFKSEKGDVGIFITNATFHKEALKFSKNLNDLVLVDDEILLNICNITNVGIKPFNDTYILDEDIFVNEHFQK